MINFSSLERVVLDCLSLLQRTVESKATDYMTTTPSNENTETSNGETAVTSTCHGRASCTPCNYIAMPSLWWTSKTYLPQSREGRSKLLAHQQPGGDPLGQLVAHATAGIAMIEENDGGEVPGVANGTSDRLVDCLHAEVLVVYLAGQAAILVPRLRGEGGGWRKKEMGETQSHKGGRIKPSKELYINPQWGCSLWLFRPTMLVLRYSILSFSSGDLTLG